jgi:prepilin-type N-terminal cleavage/methylation domain-containing protein
MKNKLPIADCRLKTGRMEQASRLLIPASRRNSDQAARRALTTPNVVSRRAKVPGVTPETTGVTPVPTAIFTIVNRKSKIGNGFTLIELLAVIAIIGVLAAFTIPVLDAVKKRQVISHTQAELGQLDAAIKSYHATYGFYPPDNHLTPPNPAINQLYYELMGVANNNGNFRTLDDQATISSTDAQATFGVSGFMNCSKPGAGEDTAQAKSFLVGLRPNQLGTNGVNSASIPFLCASVGGPDPNYAPPPLSGLNPWRYNSSNPTNNPGAYDLWVQLSINGTKYLICNWSKTVQVNNPLP